MFREAFKTSTALLCALLTSTASAARFDGIIDAMAIPLGAAHTNNSWEDTQKIKGVKWKWPYSQAGAHENTMQGSYGPKNKPTDVVVSGARTMTSEVEVSAHYPGAEIDIADFGPGNVSGIATSCDENSSGYGVAFYRFQKPGAKPLFMLRQYSYGASGQGSVSVAVAYDLADLLGQGGMNCKPIARSSTR
jgi:hypothetical protein